MKNNKKTKTKSQAPERKIYKDFTLDEYDVFTLDQQCDGAAQERSAVIKELMRMSQQIRNLSDLAPGGKLDSSIEWSILSYGLDMAVNIVRKMPHLEDRCTCPECGRG